MTEPAIPPFRQRIHLNGVEVMLDPSGAMMVPDASLLVISDLHFEKGSHYAARGQFLPPYDTRKTLGVIEALCRTYRPARVLSLGDAFHDPEAEGRMLAEDIERLCALCGAAEWLWVLGNHDPLPPKRFAGAVHEWVEIAGLTFVHEPGDVTGWNVAGHLHPCAVVAREGRRARRGCFLTDGGRMILPAMGAYTGGLNILDPAYHGLLSGPPRIYVQGERRVFGVSPSALRPDARPAFTFRRRASRAP